MTRSTKEHVGRRFEPSRLHEPSTFPPASHGVGEVTDAAFAGLRLGPQLATAEYHRLVEKGTLPNHKALRDEELVNGISLPVTRPEI